MERIKDKMPMTTAIHPSQKSLDEESMVTAWWKLSFKDWVRVLLTGKVYLKYPLIDASPLILAGGDDHKIKVKKNIIKTKNHENKRKRNT